jgi:polyisoprenoid-binding protein YceI
MTTRSRILLGGMATVVTLAAALWWFVLRSDAPPPPELGGVVTTQPTESAGPAPASSPTDLRGPWSVVAVDSFVGYRVQEELARFGFAEAVGRTSQIEGFLEISGSAITAVNIAVDMASLRSDSGLRDGTLRSQALETDEFPTATFVLVEPIELGSIPAPGTPFSTTAVGDLTIHGVTNRVALPLDAQLTGSRIEVVAALDIRFADYGIDPPSAAAVLSVEDEGQLEMQLFFTLDS